MDVSNSDADFDSYWEEEARNPNRNRIRIGRQYQATVTPLLKKGESDGRKLEELETLKWNPDNELTDQELDQYLSVAKAIGLFTQAVDKNYGQNSVDSDCHKPTDNTSETNAKETTNCEKSEDKDKEENSTSGSTSSVKDHQIERGLNGLSEFVSTHHPTHHDTGCQFPALPDQPTEDSNSLTSLLSSEWNPSETKLFSRALEVCGKNFGAIKKDFLPWKSVKSIIEYYYLGTDRESPTRPSSHENNLTQSEIVINTKPQTINNSFALDILSSVSKFMTSCVEKHPELSDGDETQGSHKCPKDNTDCNVRKNLEELRASVVSGQEVKPLKAKPILPTAIQESNNSVSTVGSLKFFLDGQLVLKLNAQQEMLGRKCQWVESADLVKKTRPIHKSGKRLLIERQDSEHQNHLNNNNKYLNIDELDDMSNESSDDDSMESNESALVPSPSAFNPKKAKVKLENSSHKPLPSPTSLPIKDQKIDISLNANNRNIKTESTVREHLSPGIEGEQRKRSSSDQLSDRRGSYNSLENKWYHTIVEKSAQHPPKAHTSAQLGQSHRHWRYDSVQSSLSSSSSSTSSTSSTSSVSSSSYPLPVPTTVSSNAIPVDLTRKSTNYSPFDTKSLPSSSSAANFGYPEKDKNSKLLSSPSPPRLQPFVFPYPAYLPLSPTQSQHKSKKEVKSSNNLCQKGVEGRSQVKPSPPTSPSSMPSSTPPLPSHSPSQLANAWYQNSLASYLPIYEQYYRLYYGYGMPAPNSSPDERQSSSQSLRESEANDRERPKRLTDGALLVDGDDSVTAP